MKGLITLGFSLALISCNALADVRTLVCHKAGYTNNPAQFHSINLQSKTSTFVLQDSITVFGDTTFTSLDPALVDMEGLAITYYVEKDNRVLYIYQNDNDQTEVGISELEPNSDAGFKDKSVYTDCSRYTQTVAPKKDSVSEPIRNVSKLTPVSYRF